MKNPKVLIVDDDPVVRNLLGQIVGESGYTAEDAEDGLSALNKVERGSYDAVFTDLMMPRMGGIDLLRRLKDIDPDLPVIIITAFPTMETGVRALKEGAADFVTKPFRLRDIKLLLNKLISQRRLLDADGGGEKRRNSLEVVNDKLYEKIKHISFLSYIAESMEEINDNGALLDLVVQMAGELTDASEVSIGFIEDDEWFVVRRSSGSQSAIRVQIAGTPMEKALRAGTSYQAYPGEKKPYGTYASHTLMGSFLAIPIMIKSEVIGFLSLACKPDGSSFTEEDTQLALSLTAKMALKFENNALYESLYTNYIDTLKALITTIEARDSYTKRHSERVTKYAMEIAEVIGLGEEESDAIKFACYLHDIGKIGVSDTVLLKAGNLSKDEFFDIKQHPVIGDSIVQSLTFLLLERTIIRHHHERWDGTGYPDGLKGLEIPLLARVVAVADAYDAMTSTRPYRTKRNHEHAVKELKAWMGSQFDPEMVKAFLKTETCCNTAY